MSRRARPRAGPFVVVGRPLGSLSVSGTVEQIAIASARGELPARTQHVVAHAGRGLEGEYHLAQDGSPADPGGALTLIGAEQLDALRADTGIELSHEASRRNVLTRGIDLNALVGRRFRVGEVLCEGVELCEPCAGLARMTEWGVLRGLVHRGGLRADVLEGGRIAVGDAVGVA
jgi:MOSC domain-containing protein YiiM